MFLAGKSPSIRSYTVNNTVLVNPGSVGGSGWLIEGAVHVYLVHCRTILGAHCYFAQAAAGDVLVTCMRVRVWVCHQWHARSCVGLVVDVCLAYQILVSTRLL